MYGSIFSLLHNIIILLTCIHISLKLARIDICCGKESTILLLLQIKFCTVKLMPLTAFGYERVKVIILSSSVSTWLLWLTLCWRDHLCLVSRHTYIWNCHLIVLSEKIMLITLVLVPSPQNPTFVLPVSLLF